ncbi:MAG: hypothetical protein KKC20_25535 [Proteobacteria bacterium]|nr:hypothetical protein [Pseudomonadota bacterium]MBU0974022.1 hypothetical protein [Pseudomonadota bacterium]
MKIVSFIVERKVIRKILCHLKLWLGRDIRGSPQWQGNKGSAPALPIQERYYELVDDGWPSYEEAVFDGD